MYSICEHPHVIRHPNSEVYCQRAVSLILNDTTYDLCPWDYAMIHEDCFKWLKHRTPSSIHVTDVKKFYFVDENGECFPMYLEVSCGKCIPCRMRRINGLTQQAEFELMNNYPFCDSFYVTLTYAQHRIPKDELLHKEHVQNYIKRVRTYVSKHFGSQYSRQMKVMYSGEYGKQNTNRPHFHIIFFHFPFYKFDCPHYQTIKFFEYMWTYHKNVKMKDTVSFDDYKVDSYCKYSLEAANHVRKHLIGRVDVQKLYSKNLSKYIAKYVGKEVGKDSEKHGAKFVEKCKQSPQFFHKSINFGVKFFEKYVAPQLRANQCNKFLYRGLDFKIHENVHVCNYYLSKIYPPASKIIPSEVKKAYDTLRWSLRSMYVRVDENTKFLRNKFSKVSKLAFDFVPNLIVNYCKLLKNRDWKIKKMFSFHYYYHHAVESIHTIARFFHEYDIDELTAYFNERNLFYSNSISEVNVIDTIFKLHEQYNKLQLKIKL